MSDNCHEKQRQENVCIKNYCSLIKYAQHVKKTLCGVKNGNQHGIKYFIVQNVVADKKRARKLIYFKSNELLKGK